MCLTLFVQGSVDDEQDLERKTKVVGGYVLAVDASGRREMFMSRSP